MVGEGFPVEVVSKKVRLTKSWQERREESPEGGQGMCKVPKEKEEAGIRKRSSKFKMAVS